VCVCVLESKREREREREEREREREREREKYLSSRSLAVFFPPGFGKACVNIRSDCGIKIVCRQGRRPLFVCARVSEFSRPLHPALAGGRGLHAQQGQQYCHDLDPLPADSSRFHMQ
jgi:hypothetical protein